MELCIVISIRNQRARLGGMTGAREDERASAEMTNTRASDVRAEAAAGEEKYFAVTQLAGCFESINQIPWNYYLLHSLVCLCIPEC